VIDLPFNWDGRRDIRSLSIGYLAPAFEAEGRYAAWKQNDAAAPLDELRGLGLTLELFELPAFPIDAATSATARSPALSSTRSFGAAGTLSSGTKGGHRDTDEAA